MGILHLGPAMPLYRLFCLLLLGLGAPATFASAQGLAARIPGPVSSVVLTRPDTPLHRAGSTASPDTVRAGIRPTYWKEGAIVGGVAGAVGVGLLAIAVCGMSDEAGKSCTGTLLLGGLLGAGLGAIPGALIGGQFPKGSRRAE